MRAFGGSSSRTATPISAVAHAHGPFEGTIAHSLGASAALLPSHRGAPLGRLAAIAQRWPWATFLETRGLGHRRLLRDADVLAAVVGFLSRRSATLAARVTEAARPASS